MSSKLLLQKLIRCDYTPVNWGLFTLTREFANCSGDRMTRVWGMSLNSGRTRRVGERLESWGAADR